MPICSVKAHAKALCSRSPLSQPASHCNLQHRLSGDRDLPKATAHSWRNKLLLTTTQQQNTTEYKYKHKTIYYNMFFWCAKISPSEHCMNCALMGSCCAASAPRKPKVRMRSEPWRREIVATNFFPKKKEEKWGTKMTTKGNQKRKSLTKKKMWQNLVRRKLGEKWIEIVIITDSFDPCWPFIICWRSGKRSQGKANWPSVSCRVWFRFFRQAKKKARADNQLLTVECRPLTLHRLQ